MWVCRERKVLPLLHSHQYSASDPRKGVQRSGSQTGITRDLSNCFPLLFDFEAKQRTGPVLILGADQDYSLMVLNSLLKLVGSIRR